MGEESTHVLLVDSTKTLWNEAIELLTLQLRRSIAEHPFALRIHLQDPALIVNRQQCIGVAIQKRSESLIGLCCCFDSGSSPPSRRRVTDKSRLSDEGN